MTKQEYLKYKQTDPSAIIYEFYKERFDKNKHRPFLQREEFNTFATMLLNIERAYGNAVEYYDKKLNVVELIDKEGKLINIL